MKASATKCLGYYELKQHELWFGEECSKLSDQRNQAKFQWLENVSPTNGGNLNNRRREATEL